MGSLRGALCAGAVLAAVCTPSAYAADPDAGATPSGPPSATPVAPVRAGGGGVARLERQRPTGTSYETPDARTEGPGTPHAVAGLVLAGAAALAVALSGGRRGRRTE